VELLRLVFVNNSGVPRGRVLDALEDSAVLRDALGETLHQSYLGVKRSEWEADYLLRAF
jgi:hypothetical protein